MEKLIKLFKNITIDDAIKIEESDFQYIALKNLYSNINNKDVYLALVIANSIVCYQLSSTGEKYWEEFSIASSKYDFKEKKDILEFFKNFLPNSRGNKRFVDTKINRLNRLFPFFNNFIGNEKLYYENMGRLQIELAKIMNQKKEDKTIVFAVKMFSYAARNYFGKLIYFPPEVTVPIDSRLTKLYEIYNEDDIDIKDFYKILAEKLKIPEMHLDAVVWVNFDKLIK